MLARTKLELQDLPVNLDEITQLSDPGLFKLESSSVSFKPHEPDLIQGIEVSMSRDLVVIQRTGYTVLDLLSDVGGLQGILLYAISLLLSIANSDQLTQYLVEKLFKVNSANNCKVNQAVTASDSSKHSSSCVLPRSLACCARSRKKRALEQAQAALNKETDIVKLIQFRRLVKLALVRLLDTHMLAEIKA